MTVAQQDLNLAAAISDLRATLDSIEQAQADGEALLALQLAELIQDSADAILWSAVANARTVPETTWAVVGGRLGITRQAAHQRFGR
jgi:hypothetical protein